MMSQIQAGPVSALQAAQLVQDAQDARQASEKYRRTLKDLLLSRFNGLSPWATTNACIALDHPARSEKHDGCCCGRRKDSV